MRGSEVEKKWEELLIEKNRIGGNEDLMVDVNTPMDEEKEGNFGLEGENGKKCQNRDKDSLGRINGCRLRSPPAVRQKILQDEDGKEEEVEVVEMDDDDLNDVEDIKDDYDIMEVEEEEDLLGKGSDNKTTPLTKGAPLNKANGSFPLPSGPKRVVTIADVKVSHKVAESNPKESTATANKNTVVFIGMDSNLAGKTGVGIRPASRFKTNSLPNFPAGVTISDASKVGNYSASSTSNTKKTELSYPYLIDGSFVVLAPSFIVPFVFEKPPKETFSEFWEDIKKLQNKMRDEKHKKKEQTTKKLGNCKEEGDDNDPEFNPDAVIIEDEKAKLSSESSSEEEDEIFQSSQKTQSENYIESPLGNFFMDLGLNLVQEAVQIDVLKQQIRKRQCNQSFTIMSLKKNLEALKENNRYFHFDMKKCKMCSYKTESQLVMSLHLEISHIRMTIYRCNFFPYETKFQRVVLFHMMNQHRIQSKLKRSPFLHQCPQCPFEDKLKRKIIRHKTACNKIFLPEKNLEPAFDWEPPAKNPKPHVSRTSGGIYSSFSPGPIAESVSSSTANVRSNINRGFYSGMPQRQLGGSSISMARSDSRRSVFNVTQSGRRQNVGGRFMKDQLIFQALKEGGCLVSSNSFALLPGNLANSASITTQSVNQRNCTLCSNSANIPMTPLPWGSSSENYVRPLPSVMRPGQPNAVQGRGNLGICKICDGFMQDFEQLRNHMQGIHKIKIYPMTIHNRPPFVCQICKYCFFTNQGLERHLLGSHGLVTTNMEELANKGQDSGRCPICGKVFMWKLVNHMAEIHQKTLKLVHLF